MSHVSLRAIAVGLIAASAPPTPGATSGPAAFPTATQAQNQPAGLFVNAGLTLNTPYMLVISQ